jgi:hypothetical protein
VRQVPAAHERDAAIHDNQLPVIASFQIFQ